MKPNISIQSLTNYKIILTMFYDLMYSELLAVMDPVILGFIYTM